MGELTAPLAGKIYSPTTVSATEYSIPMQYRFIAPIRSSLDLLPQFLQQKRCIFLFTDSFSSSSWSWSAYLLKFSAKIFIMCSFLLNGFSTYKAWFVSAVNTDCAIWDFKPNFSRSVTYKTLLRENCFRSWGLNT